MPVIAAPPARARSGRVVLVAGLIDSLGLSMGWTAFLLITVARQGLPDAGLYNAAMFAGVVVSAPVAAWLAERLGGRAFLNVVGTAELCLRVLSFVALLAGWPVYAVAALVLAMNVATWSGYAGMRAEIAQRDTSTRALTRYAVVVSAVEAAGTMVAALLPVMSADGNVDTALVAPIVVVYAVSLAPQFWCARSSRVPSGRAARAIRASVSLPTGRTIPSRGRFVGSRRRVILLASGTLMLLASGPATLSTPLADELNGRLGVVLSALAVCGGCLAAPACSSAVRRLGLPMRARWTLWGVAMLAGWITAPLSLGSLLLAQSVSAAALTAFQGEADTTVAAMAAPGRETAALAWVASARAGGSAVAARTIPLLVAAPQIGVFSAVAGALVLAACPLFRIGRDALALRRRDLRTGVVLAPDAAHAWPEATPFDDDVPEAVA